MDRDGSLSALPCTVLLVDFFDADHPHVTICSTLEQLTSALSALHASKKCWVSIEAQPKGKGMGLGACMRVLQGEFHLPPFSVMDVLNGGSKVKVDRSSDGAHPCIYTAMLGFRLDKPNALVEPFDKSSGLFGWGGSSKTADSSSHAGGSSSYGDSGKPATPPYTAAKGGPPMVSATAASTTGPWSGASTQPSLTNGNVRVHPSLRDDAGSGPSMDGHGKAAQHLREFKAKVGALSSGKLSTLLGGGQSESDGSRETVHSQASKLAQALGPSWERACFFLTRTAVVSIHMLPRSPALVETRKWFCDPSQNALERRKGAPFLFYRIVESTVNNLSSVLARYREAILTYEQRTFTTDRPSTLQDTFQTLQLHLLHRELGTMRQHMQPVSRVLATLLGLSGGDAGGGSSGSGGGGGDEGMTVMSLGDSGAEGNGELPRPGSRGLAAVTGAVLDAETVDFLEEVEDDVQQLISEIHGLEDSARSLIELMFNLTAYRSTVSQSTLAGVSAIFLPLTFLAGIYGMNWKIFPELYWGVDEEEEDQLPAGWPAGYMFFWVITVVISTVGITILRAKRIF